MAPAGKLKPETQGPAPAPPLLECALSKDVDLTPVLPWTRAESNEHGRTVIPILEVFSRDISAKMLTGGMIVNEFLVQRLAPLQAHSRPLWDNQLGHDMLRLRSHDLPTQELKRVMTTQLGGEPGDLPAALGPLYCLDDRADLIAVLPVFDERGLLPA
ncbi:hypothetical protein D1007_56974 [Hordeum vulgare]|nr:hypothetical protein D1007_56974 [Hordeum vulgare]